jgi:hypothetical protein
MVLRPASGLERAVHDLRGFKEGGLHESLGVWMCEAEPVTTRFAKTVSGNFRTMWVM